MTTKKNFSVNPNQSSSESLLKDIRRNTKRIFTSEQKVLIVMEGIRGEHSIAELCRKYGISDSTYYKWNKDFIEAGKARLDGDTIRETTNDEVKELRQKIFVWKRPLHPQTQGKIERYHRSMKNVIKLNHYFCPSELENAINGWVKYYNERRFHESLDNLTPKDVYLGQGEKIKKIREIIKQNSINKRIFDNKTRKYQSK